MTPGPRDQQQKIAAGGPLAWAGKALLNLVYPRLCGVCELPLSFEIKDHFCDGCSGRIELVQAPFCEVCGEAFDGEISDAFECVNCHGRRIEFDFARAGARLNGPAREMIHRFKYEKRIDLGAALASLLEKAVADERITAAHSQGGWTLVPVPLHPKRLRERGYNQSAEIARLLSRKTGIPMRDALRRVRHTPTQASLDRKERLKNLKGAFAVRRSMAASGVLKGKRVLLVDDVLTTGATGSACAKVLKAEAGVSNVVVITVARG